MPYPPRRLKSTIAMKYNIWDVPARKHDVSSCIANVLRRNYIVESIVDVRFASTIASMKSNGRRPCGIYCLEIYPPLTRNSKRMRHWYSWNSRSWRPRIQWREQRRPVHHLLLRPPSCPRLPIRIIPPPRPMPRSWPLRRHRTSPPPPPPWSHRPKWRAYWPIDWDANVANRRV